MRPLSTEDFTRRRAAGAVVLDARSPQDFAAGHLRGSVNVPADGRFAEREAGPPPRLPAHPLAELARRTDEIPADRPLVVHCAGGHRSSIAAGPLRHQGRADVSDLLGGYTAWSAEFAPAGA